MEAKRKNKIMAEVIQIINALIWAALMLMVSYTLKGTQNFEIIFTTIVIGAAIEIALLGFITKKFLSKNIS